MLAVEQQNEQAFKTLWNKGGSDYEKHMIWKEALDLAFSMNKKEIADFLFNHQRDKHTIVFDIKTWSDLSFACARGDLELFKDLPLKTINEENGDGSFPLQIAAFFNHQKVVLQLINEGALLSQCDRQRNTALMTASSLGHVEIIDQLVLNGAMKTPLNLEGKTAYDLACENGHGEAAHAISEGKAADNSDNGMVFLLVFGTLVFVPIYIGLVMSH